MKKFFTLSSLFISTLIFSQTISFTNVDTIVYGQGSDAELVGYATIKNITTEEISLRVRKTEVSIVEGSVNYFCWDACFEPQVMNSGFLYIGAGATNNSFSGHLEPNGSTGISVVRYCFTNNINTDNPCIEIAYNVTPVSVEKINPAKTFLSNVYPNPAVNTLNVNYNLPAGNLDGTLVIYNAIGVKVKELKLNNTVGKSTFDVSDLQSGIYNLALIVNGKLETAKRFVVKN